MTKIYDLIPRLISHQETQQGYYEHQLEAVQKELARLAILDSGQLQLWKEPLYTPGTNEAYVLSATMGGDEKAPRTEARPGIQ